MRTLKFFLLIILIFIVIVIIYYIYKLIILDVSDVKKILENNKNKKFIMCGYGHTSWMDIPFYILAGIRIGNIKCLAKKKYKIFYPKFTHKYIHFIENNTTKKKFNTNLTLLIEGTRSYKKKLKTGFIYLAKNNNAKIIFFINNDRKNKVEISEITNYDDNDILKNLKKLIKGKSKKDYSFFCKNCSEIVI